jgi:hypothetical protein
MAAVTRLGLYGGPALPYGAFSGKAPGASLGEVALYATVSVVPALQVDGIDITPALAATAAVTPALRARVQIN